MKLILKKTVVFLLVISALLATSCASRLASVSECTVTYVYGDERENSVKTYQFRDFIENERPKRDGFEFVGWCTDKNLTNFYNFATPIVGDITLYAKWDTDYQALLETVTSKQLRAAVKVVVPGLFGTSGQGSGVVYKAEGSTWYALTNAHVVTSSGVAESLVYVYDSTGDQYTATVLKVDTKYDLAVLKIKASRNAPFLTMNVDNRIPEKNEELVTVSTPNGQYNTVNFGKMAWYGSLDTESSSLAESDVDFDVLWITGAADHGSSGGAVYDMNNNIVGIIYAVATDRESGEKHVLAIPANKILEFLATIEY